MWQRNLDVARTLHGVGQLEENSRSVGGSWEPSFVPIGARVGQSGQVFETDGNAGPGSLVVKLFTRAAGLPEQVVQDFTREAMTVASLRHPHIAQVVDAGTLGDGTPFVVMERLAGVTLDEVAGGRLLPVAEVLAVLRGVGSALSAAHAAGVAHGEVRADNVFLAEPAGHAPQWPMLLDFGAARLAAGASTGAPPRFELDGRAGARADQLALAAMAWRLLGGESAPAVQRALLRAMSPDPSRRFSTVAAFVDAVEEAFAHATTAGLAGNAAAVTTLVRGALPAPSRRPAVATPAIPPMVTPAPAVANAPAVAKAPAVANAPAVATPPSSLTQQFFAEGEQMEAAHAAGRTSDARAATEQDEADDEDGADALQPPVASRVPRSRAQMIAAVLLALGSVALIVWTVVSLADRPADDPSAAAAPPAPSGRPTTVAPAPGAWPAVGALDRNARRTATQGRRAPRVQPAPFPATSPPSVTTLQAPRPWVGPPPPAAPAPAATPSAPAPTPAAAPSPGESPTPPLASTPAPPAEATFRDSDQTKPFPDVAPTANAGDQTAPDPEPIETPAEPSRVDPQ